jgi:hypothetical protein
MFALVILVSAMGAYVSVQLDHARRDLVACRDSLAKFEACETVGDTVHVYYAVQRWTDGPMRYDVDRFGTLWQTFPLGNSIMRVAVGKPVR